MTKLPIVFRQKKPLFLRLISINHWKNKQKLCQNKDMSSKWSCGLVECSFVNLIERVLKKLTSFCWMSENDGRKTFLTEKIFTTNCCNGQTDSGFDDTTEKFSSESQEKTRSSFNDEQKKRIFSKKNLFNRSPWQVVISFLSKLLFVFRHKKPFFFVQCSRRMKKQTETFQSRCLSSKWSFGLLESSVVHLAEKNSNKDWSICDRCPKYWGKNIWRNFFYHNPAKLTNRKQHWKRTDKFPSKWHTKVAQCPMMKKRTFSKKNLHKIFLDTW